MRAAARHDCDVIVELGDFGFCPGRRRRGAVADTPRLDPFARPAALLASTWRRTSRAGQLPRTHAILIH
jgi:hypothetical protein